MANFPTTLPSISNPSSTDYLNSPPHATQHATANNEVIAIATKVGVNSSAVTTTHDYKLSSVATGQKAVSTSGDQTITGNKTLSGTTTLSGNVTMSGTNSLTGATTVAKTVNTITAATDGATVTFNLALGNIHTVTLGGNRILALSGASTGQVFIIRLLQDGSGGRTVTWFSTIKWAGGTAPTLTTTASKADAFGFICTSSNNYDGFVVGQNI